MECVQDLRAEFVSHAPYVRPLAKSRAAPVDQVSQRLLFMPEARGTMESFLAWAVNRQHPADDRFPPLEADLEAAIQFVWRMGAGIAAERQRRMSILQSVAARLEPLSVLITPWRVSKRAR